MPGTVPSALHALFVLIHPINKKSPSLELSNLTKTPSWEMVELEHKHTQFKL